MRFEAVRDRLAAMPPLTGLPEGPAALMPVRVDSDEPLFAGLPDPGRQAAVLVLLFPDESGEARILLTERPAHMAAHAGEVSFPGGGVEEGDDDAAATALREACEEVGLDPDSCGLRVAGTLEPLVIPVSGFRITPVLALADRRPICTASPHEVERILEPPVEAFLPGAPVEIDEREVRGRRIRYGVYPVEGARVWGATARILGRLGALLEAERD